MKRHALPAILIISIFSVLGFICYCIFCFDEEAQGSVYANSIVISNCPRSIDMYLKNQIVLNDDFCSVTPADYTSGITTEVLDSEYNESGGLRVYKNTITARKTGSFYIRFKVLISYGMYSYDTLKVNVVNHSKDAVDSLELTSNYFKTSVGKSFNLLTTLDNVTKYTRSVKFELNGEEINSDYTPTLAGVYSVKAYVDLEGYKNITSFQFEAKDESNYELVVYGEAGDEFSDGTITVDLSKSLILLSYDIIGMDNQDIIASISNPLVANVDVCAPIISIELKSVGEAELKLVKDKAELIIKIVVI